MLKKLIQRWRCRFNDWLLRRIPHRVIQTKSPKLVRVQLMADTGAKVLAQIDWDVTCQDFPELENARHIALAVSIWEGGDTSTRLAAFAHLLPGKRHSPLPNRLLRREPAENTCSRFGYAPHSIQGGLASSQIHT